jgi:hypothetical protein
MALFIEFMVYALPAVVVGLLWTSSSEDER